MTQPTDFLNRAEELAPAPKLGADPAEWVRHFAAQALAAYAAFRISERTEPAGPHLGYLALLGTAAMAASVSLEAPSETAARVIWELTPEAGALNGEWIDHLADTLEAHGINPADLYPWFEAKDFTAPARLPKVEVA
jgi:hypothetical protein